MPSWKCRHCSFYLLTEAAWGISPGLKRSYLTSLCLSFHHMQNGDSNGTDVIGCSDTECAHKVLREVWLGVRLCKFRLLLLPFLLVLLVLVSVLSTLPCSQIIIEFVKLPHPCFFPSECIYLDFFLDFCFTEILQIYAKVERTYS